MRSYGSQLRELLSAFLAAVLVVATLAVALAPAGARAADDDDETSTVAPKGPADKVRRKHYPGGRDEEDLTVQASLPQPVRSPDATPGMPGDNESHD